MKYPQSSSVVLTVLLLLAVATGCSEKNNPIAAYEPEVITNADAFQFQITDASNVSTTLEYEWDNSETRASIDHSTALTNGSASVVILDADGVQVYSSGLKASGTESSSAGTVGTWKVRVVFDNFGGTANFRVEKL